MKVVLGMIDLGILTIRLLALMTNFSLQKKSLRFQFRKRLNEL